jgi:LacI family transcriptional regulator
MKPSLQEIAQRVGVSTATVSRALNDRAGVHPDTRRQILEVARELGYTPHAAARGLATSRTHTLGMIHYSRVPQQPISNYPNLMVQGADQAARQLGYHIITTFADDDMMADAMRLALVSEQRVDGLILVGPALKSSFILQLVGSGLPVVLIDNLLSETAIDAVVYDNVQGAYQATRHLIDMHNLRRLTFLSGPADWLSSRERCKGYETALAEVGESAQVVHMPDTTIQTGYHAMAEVLERFPDTQGVVAVNDATAFGAIRYCKEANCCVPDDIAVVGFDDVNWAALHDPPLTTIRTYSEETGIQAVRRLIDSMQREVKPGLLVRLSTELIVRESCGCPPRATGDFHQAEDDTP